MLSVKLDRPSCAACRMREKDILVCWSARVPEVEVARRKVRERLIILPDLGFIPSVGNDAEGGFTIILSRTQARCEVSKVKRKSHLRYIW